MISILAFLATQAATAISWSSGNACPGLSDVAYRADGVPECSAEDIYSGTAHQLTMLQFADYLDRYCSIWNTLTMSQNNICRSNRPSGDVWFHPSADLQPTSGFTSLAGPNSNWVGWAPQWPMEGDCDIALRCEAPADAFDVRWATCDERTTRLSSSGFDCSPNNVPSWGTNRNGGALSNVAAAPDSTAFQSVLIHEIGHHLGLSHASSTSPCGRAVCDTDDDCPVGATCIQEKCNAHEFIDGPYCPSMSPLSQDSPPWPTADDTYYLRQPRSVTVRLANVGSQAAVFPETDVGACTLADYSTYVAPRIGCGATSVGYNACAVSFRPNRGSGAAFAFVDVISATSPCSFPTVLTTNTATDGSVDVAQGTNGRVLGIARRPNWTPSHPFELVVFSFNALSTSVTVRMIDDELGYSSQPVGEKREDDLRTIRVMTEPRISYHETTNHMIVAYADTQSNVRLLALSSTGIPIKNQRIANSCSSYIQCGPGYVCSNSGVCESATIETGYASTLPVELSCDTHRSGSESTCTLYVLPNCAGSTCRSGRWFQHQFNVAASGLITMLPDPSPFELRSPPNSSGTGLLIDAVSFGEGRKNGQWPGNGWFVFTKPFFGAISSQSKTGIFAEFAGPLYTDTPGMTKQYITPSSAPPTKVDAPPTSWDWAEYVGRLVFTSPQ